MRLRSVLLAAVMLPGALGALDAARADATPMPESLYRIAATHAEWGPAVGWMWGDPSLGMRMWLSGTFGTAEFGYTIGGRQDHVETAAGTIVLDRWIASGNGRLVATYVADGPAQGAASGGGRIDGWAITVLSHT